MLTSHSVVIIIYAFICPLESAVLSLLAYFEGLISEFIVQDAILSCHGFLSTRSITAWNTSDRLQSTRDLAQEIVMTHLFGHIRPIEDELKFVYQA